MSILRDTLFRKALQLMAANGSLDRIMSGMDEYRLDPYSAVEEIIAKLMPDDTSV